MSSPLRPGAVPARRHIVSGPAAGCSQKNHNILAGIRALDEAADLLVCCDSTHQARPDFLRELLHPLVTGAAVLASGFHRIVPGDARVPTLGMLQTVLTLHLLHGFAFIALPWGGATAILRETFESLNVAHLWAETVVDDVSLAARLIKARIPVCLSRGADLATPVAGETLKSWESWLFRQWSYLKYYLPASWMAAGMLTYLLTGFTLMSLVNCSLSPGAGVRRD